MFNNKLNKKILITEYNVFKEKAIENFNKQNNELALRQIEYICNIAASFPIKYEYCDNEIEKILIKIGIECYNKVKINKQESKNILEERIVFYNGQIVDSGALTEQYLNVFENRNSKILLIVPDASNTLLGKNIINKIRKNSNIKLFIPHGKSRLSKIEQIIIAISDFEPTNAFLHLLPNDAVGIASFSPFTNFTKYFIVHNDHTFWLGKHCADYFIEFRNFGVSLSFERRQISKEKILKIPYYPIINGNKFQGFPFDRNGKVVGISGANLEKYYADNNLNYFKIIKELLDENPNFVFCLCGWGNSKPITDFIKINGLHGRFFYMGKRSDFYELIGNCDILFESFPVKGGLTVLMATEQKIPAIGISTYNNPSGALEDLLEIENYKQPKNFEEFKIETNKLIKDKKFRQELGIMLFNNHFNKKEFEESVNGLLNNCKITRKLNVLPLYLNDDAYLKEYLNKSVSTLGNLLYSKWFIVGGYMTTIERVSSLMKIIMICNSNSIKIIGKIFLRTIA